jgi:hypothetical protein
MGFVPVTMRFGYAFVQNIDRKNETPEIMSEKNDFRIRGPVILSAVVGEEERGTFV